MSLARSFAAALDEFLGPPAAQGIIETAAVRFISCLDRQFFFGQSIRIRFGECFQPLCLS